LDIPLVASMSHSRRVARYSVDQRQRCRLRTNALEEHDQLQLEEDDRVDAGAAPVGIQLLRPLSDEAQVQLGLKVAGEVVAGEEFLQRDGDRLLEAAELSRAEHGRLRTLNLTFRCS